MKQNKQNRRSQRTRRLVSSAMAELLLEKHYDAITVQDLLDRARSVVLSRASDQFQTGLTTSPIFS